MADAPASGMPRIVLADDAQGVMRDALWELPLNTLSPQKIAEFQNRLLELSWIEGRQRRKGIQPAMISRKAREGVDKDSTSRWWR